MADASELSHRRQAAAGRNHIWYFVYLVYLLHMYSVVRCAAALEYQSRPWPAFEVVPQKQLVKGQGGSK